MEEKRGGGSDRYKKISLPVRYIKIYRDIALFSA
jgi:hypothetical protein